MAARKRAGGEGLVSSMEGFQIIAAGSAAPLVGFRLRQIDPDRLGLEVGVQPLAPQLTPEAALLVAAEGDGGVIDAVAVDPHGPRLQRPRGPMRLLDIARPDAGRETVEGVVGPAQHLLEVLEPDDREDGAEDLLACDLHRVLDAGEHVGLEKVAPAVADLGPPPSCDDAGPLALAG